MMEEQENETMSMNKCDSCKKMFGEKEWGKLNRHKKLSHDLPCTNCNLVFVDDLDLKKHLRENHGVGVGANCFAYECRKCLKKSQSIATNIKHEQLEHPHKCKACIVKQVAYPFSFINNNDLKTHKVKMHNGEMDEKEASLNAKDTDDGVEVVAVMPKLIKEKKFQHIKLECLPKDGNLMEMSTNECFLASKPAYYESCEIDENANKLGGNATNQNKTAEQPTNYVVQYNHENKRNQLDSADDPDALEESPLGPEEPVIQNYNLKLEFDMLEEKSTPTEDNCDRHLHPQPQSKVYENEASPLMGGLWNQNLLILNENPPANIREPGRGRVRVRGGFVKSRGQRKPDDDNHTSGLKVIIPNSSEEVHEMHSVPIYIPVGAVSNTGPDGKVSYLFPLNSQLQNPTMVRLDGLVNPSFLISSTPEAQAVGTPRETLLPLGVGTPPISRSPIAGSGTFRMGRGVSPVRATGPLETSWTSSSRYKDDSTFNARLGSVRMRGAPGGPLVRGRMPMPMRLGAPSYQGSPGGIHVRGMRTRPRMPMGRGLTGMRGAPGGTHVKPRMPMECGVPGMRGAPGGPRVRGMIPKMAMGRGATGMQGAAGGTHVRGMRPMMQMERGVTGMRGAAEGPLQRGMRPRMQMGRGTTGMRGAPEGPLQRETRPRMQMVRGAPGMRGVRLPSARGAARGSRPFSPQDPFTPVVRADLPPAPEHKKIKVEINLSSDEEITLSSFEESPPPNSANPALDRLKHCGISVSRLPSGISLSQVPSGYSVNQMHTDVQRHNNIVAERLSDVREVGVAGSSSFLPAPEESAKAPKSQVHSVLNRTLDLDTLTPEQINQLKMMGII